MYWILHRISLMTMSCIAKRLIYVMIASTGGAGVHLLLTLCISREELSKYTIEFASGE